MRTRFSLGAVTALVGLASVAPNASADTFEVTRTGDPVPGPCKPRDCSLREAVDAANARPGGDRVILPQGRYELTRSAPGFEDANLHGDLDVTAGPLTIAHPGGGRATIDANGNDRVLHVQSAAPTTLIGIGVTGGAVTSDGGGIRSDSSLTLVRSRVSGNVGDDGGGIDVDFGAGLLLRQSAVAGNQAATNAASNGGGINTGDPGTLVRLTRSTVSGNRALGDGGGIEGAGAEVRLIRSTVAGNRTGEDGGGLHSANSGEIRIIASTISANRAEGGGADGGGVYVDGPPVVIVNSTIAGNRATIFGGGIHAQDGADVSLNAVTVARNVADTDGVIPLGYGGGGLFRLSSAGFDVRNSLIALNRSNVTPNDCDGDPFDSLGHNLLSTTSGGDCAGFDEPTDLIRSNPRLGALADHGGPTKTVSLRRRSPAIGRAHRPSAPDRDQRGRRRDRRPDIGSFERGA